MTALCTVTIDQLKALLTTAELEAVPSMTTQGATDGDAWLQDRLRNACDRVVAAVNACARNQSIATGLCKVPAACVHTALVLARQAVIASIPGVSEVLEGSTRAAEYAEARETLRQLASCQLAVDYSLGDDEAADASEGSVIRARRVPTFLF